MSVGHVARIFEEAGLATVVVGIRAFRPRLAAMTLPRLLVTPHLMGRPLGPPGDDERQRATVLAALDLLDSAGAGGTVIELPGRYRVERQPRVR